MDSILDTIKKLLGYPPEYTEFDTDIIVAINNAFFSLHQLGVGTDAYRISDNQDTWTHALGSATDLESIKMYIYLKCRVTFDPPSNAFVMNSFTEQIKELEWRINVEVDPNV